MGCAEADIFIPLGVPLAGWFAVAAEAGLGLVVWLFTLILLF